MQLQTYLNQYTCDIRNKDHIITIIILAVMIVITLYSFKQYVVAPISKKNTHFSVSFSKKETTANPTEQIVSPSVKQTQRTENKEKKAVMNKKKSTKESVVSLEKKVEQLNQIFDQVEAKEKPANTVPMYDQIDYEKNAAELGLVLKNKDIPLPKLESEELSKKEEITSVQNMPDVDAIANMLYNHLKDDKTETYPELPSDWVRKWQDVEGLVVVVGLLVDSEGNVIKTALIKSSGIPKADTIVQYGLIGAKYDMSNQLITGQYKWLEIALSFNEDTF